MPHEVESDDVQARGVSCVASGEELYQAFLRRGLVPSEAYYFDVHNPAQQYYMMYTTFTIVYNTKYLAENANGTVNMDYTLPESSSEMCCNPFDDDCLVIQTRRHFVFRVIPAPLVYMLATPWLNLFYIASQSHGLPNLLSNSEFIGCWSTPPLCACHQKRSAVLSDFTSILVGHTCFALQKYEFRTT